MLESGVQLNHQENSSSTLRGCATKQRAARDALPNAPSPLWVPHATRAIQAQAWLVQIGWSSQAGIRISWAMPKASNPSWVATERTDKDGQFQAIEEKTFGWLKQS
jgi:hypothetical protein